MRECQRQDLRVSAECVISCTVSDDGDTDISRWLADEPDIVNIGQYYCAECLRDFVPEGNSDLDMKRAWQSALEHLVPELLDKAA